MGMNQLCQVLKIKKPVIQGPMAYVSTAPLVAAVSNAGGFGVLGVAAAPPEFVEFQIHETRKLTAHPFGVNVFMVPELLELITPLLIREKPAVVYADILANLSSDLCQEYFPQWKDAGLKIIVKASTIEDAITAERGGADVIVVKGWEGGGHVTPETTMVLVPQAADILSVPVVAGGGIADGRGMAAAIALGAVAVEMGSIFLCAKETDIPDCVKQAVINAGDMESVVTGLSTGEPCRQLKNRLSDIVLSIEAENPAKVAAAKIRDMVEGSLKKAMMGGDIDFEGAVMVGQIAPLIKDIRPVVEIIDSTITQAKAILAKSAGFVF